MAGIKCDIVTPEALLVSEDAEMVVGPGVEGSMGFLAGHEPLVSALSDGEVRVKSASDGSVSSYALQGGYVEVSAEKVIVLANRAIAKADIKVDEVKAKLAEVEASLAKLSAEEAAGTTLADDRSWCEAQLQVAQAA